MDIENINTEVEETKEEASEDEDEPHFSLVTGTYTSGRKYKVTLDKGN
jgi:hypothetical protein